MAKENNYKWTFADIVTRVIFGIFLGLFVFLIVCFFTQSSTMKKFESRGVLAKIFGNDTQEAFDAEATEVVVDINWEKKYPFKDLDTPSYIIPGKSIKAKKVDQNTNEEIAEKVPALRRYLSLFETYTGKIEEFSSARMPFRENMVMLAKGLESSIGYHYGKSAEYIDKLIYMENGFLTYEEEEVEDKEINEIADSMEDFCSFLNEQGVGFLYVNAGSKVCPVDKEMSPADAEKEHTNERGDNLTDALNIRSVPNLDIRQNMISDLDWYDSYYITDHHWKNTTQIWAAGEIAKRLNQDFGFNFDSKYFNPDNYSISTKEKYWYGGEGRTDAFANSDLEAFSLVIPKYDTDFSIQVPTLDWDYSGPYEQSLFDMKKFEHIAKYSKKDFLVMPDAYSCSRIGNNALTHLENHLQTDNDGKKILMLQDSFGWYTTAYLAADIKNVDVIHPMTFDGSIRSYIEETQPDMVILLYCERNIKPIDWTTHKAQFDLR